MSPSAKSCSRALGSALKLDSVVNVDAVFHTILLPLMKKKTFFLYVKPVHCYVFDCKVSFTELLRKSAENILMDMVQLLFSRLPQFKEDPKWASAMKRVRPPAISVPAV